MTTPTTPDALTKAQAQIRELQRVVEIAFRDADTATNMASRDCDPAYVEAAVRRIRNTLSSAACAIPLADRRFYPNGTTR